MTESEWLASTDPAAMLAWLTGDYSPVARDIGPNRVSDRKLRLFACACCRSVWHRFDTNARQCVQAAENVADRLCAPLGDDGTNILSRVLDVAALDDSDRFVSESERRVASMAACCHWDHNNRPASLANLLANAEKLDVTRAAQADILRDIVGNPFRPVVLPTEMVWIEVPYEHASDRMIRRCSWLTPLVVSLTQSAYDNRLPSGQLDPEILAVLSDALEDAECPVSIQTCYLCNGTGIYQQEHPWGDTYAVETLTCHACQGERTGAVAHPLLDHLRSPGPHWRGCWAVDLLLGKE